MWTLSFISHLILRLICTIIYLIFNLKFVLIHISNGSFSLSNTRFTDADKNYLYLVSSQVILDFSLGCSLVGLLLFHWNSTWTNKSEVLQQRIKPNKKISAAEPQWNCHTLLQCELRHTAEPHTSLQTWGLYILNNICLSFSSLSFLLCLQENGINKPICMQIINHYLDPSPVYVYKDYNLPGLCIILLGCLWFGFPCVHPDVFHVTRPDQPVCVMHEWLPAGIYVAAYDAVTQLTNVQKISKVTALPDW